MAINVSEHALATVSEDAKKKWLDEVCNGAHSTSIDRLLSQPLAEDFKLQDASQFFSQVLPGAIAVAAVHTEFNSELEEHDLLDLLSSCFLNSVSI